MPRSLDHLPAGKRAELAFVVEVLTAGFDEERSTRWAKHLKNGQILRIILYGSYARGDWVEDAVGRYFSDYDLLVVVADEKHADVLEFWSTAEKRLLAELSSGERLRTPVNFIVHTQAEVDDALTLDDEIQNLAFIIDRAPKEHQSAADCADDLTQMPARGRVGSAVLQPPAICGPNFFVQQRIVS
ncbi:MAG: nucleotidyltransferase domain-containing protein [Brevundimonas sp.]|nr:MAG: nucleotidyltransferase domain-containing protein [Brevundimonas sp.]